MKTIDVKGLKCPLPLIETKKALKQLPNNEALKVIIDNEISKNNVIRFLTDNGIKSEISRNGKVFEVIVNHHNVDLENVEAEKYCTIDPPEKDDYVILFGKDRLGEGSNDLGFVLAGALLNTLKEMDNLPQKIIFINSGINFVLKGSPTLLALNELEKAGVELITCGTCLDYFDKTEEFAIGRISNMYEILESMTKAGKVINI
jgi:selenium metabolism protein YedF